MVFSIVSFEQQEPTFQNPIFSNLDALYCEEDGFGFGFEEDFEKGVVKCEENLEKKGLNLLENDLFWENDEILRLLAKEKETHLGYFDDDNKNLDPNGLLLMVPRNEGVEWMLKVVAHFGFNALTAVLAVNYYDRFVSSFGYPKDKPWMSQLVAVACLSIAAKMEEIQVPLLLDLQVENSKFVFEAKTIMRMEILVLSTLKWKTSVVTPISFIDHFARRFGLMTNLHCEFLPRCERVVLAIVADIRLVHYLPSVIATAVMLFVMNEIEHCDVMEYKNQLIDVLKSRKENVDECFKLVVEHMTGHHLGRNETRKRKNHSVPGSPCGVIDSYFSNDSSNDSWSVASSPEPVFKRSRAREQPMKLASLSSVSLGISSEFR